jgi:hypothetical protein
VSALDPAVLAYRAEQNAKAIDRLNTWRIDTDKAMSTAAVELREVRKDIGDLSDQLASVKRLVISALVSVTTGSVLLSLSLLIATGKIG